MTTITLTEEQKAFLPTEEEIVEFERKGYYVSKPGTLPDDLIERAMAGAHRFYAGERDAHLPVDAGFSNWTPADGIDVPRNNEFVSLQKKELMDLVKYPLIGAIGARLLRIRSLRLLDDQLIFKPPMKGPATDTITGWHADGAYWATCSSDSLITAWAPFHDVPVERSPLVVMEGSHRWSGLEHTRFFNNKNLGEIEEMFRTQGRDVKVVPLVMKRGQFSFHHRWTMHASLPNTSGQPRLSFAMHLQDGDNRYRAAFRPDGREIHIADELMCRKQPNGDPDFTDPVAFPLLWSEA
jgi:hypothetical protein